MTGETASTVGDATAAAVTSMLAADAGIRHDIVTGGGHGHHGERIAGTASEDALQSAGATIVDERSETGMTGRSGARHHRNSSKSQKLIRRKNSKCSDSCGLVWPPQSFCRVTICSRRHRRPR